jgi:hypothetical protein
MTQVTRPGFSPAAFARHGQDLSGDHAHAQATTADLTRIKYGAWLIAAAFLLLGTVFWVAVSRYPSASDVAPKRAAARPSGPRRWPWASSTRRLPTRSCGTCSSGAWADREKSAGRCISRRPAHSVQVAKSSGWRDTEGKSR